MDPPAPRSPLARNGCAVMAGWFLAMIAGFVGAVVAISFDAPPWVVIPVFFGPAVLFIAGGVVLGVRHARKAAAENPLAAEQAAVLSLVLPLVLGFFAVAALAFGAVFVARLANAPGWAEPVAFLLPGVLFAVLAWPAMRTLGERMKRAAPSPERQAAIAAPRPVTTNFHPGPAPAADPALPPDPTFPGRTLAVRLPPADVSAGCACAGVLGMALFWNGIVSVFVWQAAAAWVAGRPEWFLMVFLIPFVLIGVVLVVVTAVMAVVWVVSLLTGKIVVEVDGHPFVPGGTYRGLVTQGGLVRVTRAAVELVCEESATYQAGTSESTATEVVAEVPAGPRDPDAALPLDFAVTVPADAMHSFAAAKNKIRWKLKVYGRVLGFLPYGGAFEVVVRPGG